MPKESVDWPEDISLAKQARSDRIACLISLQRKDLDFVNKMLSEDLDKLDMFNLMIRIETTHPAKDHLEKWQSAYEVLLDRLSKEDYSENLIAHVKKTLA